MSGFTAKTERTKVSLADATYDELLRLRRDNYTLVALYQRPRKFVRKPVKS